MHVLGQEELGHPAVTATACQSACDFGNFAGEAAAIGGVAVMRVAAGSAARSRTGSSCSCCCSCTTVAAATVRVVIGQVKPNQVQKQVPDPLLIRMCRRISKKVPRVPQIRVRHRQRIVAIVRLEGAKEGGGGGAQVAAGRSGDAKGIGELEEAQETVSVELLGGVGEEEAQVRG